ncbi:ribokinase [Pigmentiphaga soli]|uniref:Deoxyribokinase n=1 Tax=Pigmentiphaga soli TaxID=1007095 RepID=A0ABP8HMW1_9BURK
MPTVAGAPPEPPRIAVLGSFMQACCWRMARLPRRGESVCAEAFATEPAGKGLSVAVGSRRLGARVDLLMAIGNDYVGDRLLQRLSDEGLAAGHVHRRGARSGYGAGLEGGGDNAIAVFPGANALLAPADVAAAEADIAAAGLLYGQFEVPPATVEAAFRAARAHGTRTVLNPSPWRPLAPALLALADVLIVNAVEARALLRRPLAPDRAGCAARLAAALPALRRRWRGEWLVVSLGAEGSLAVARDGSVAEAPALPVPATRSVGAGDAFSAGFCVALARGAGVRQALREGNACAALAVGRDGILDALPRAEELAAALRPSA